MDLVCKQRGGCTVFKVIKVKGNRSWPIVLSHHQSKTLMLRSVYIVTVVFRSICFEHSQHTHTHTNTKRRRSLKSSVPLSIADRQRVQGRLLTEERNARKLGKDERQKKWSESLPRKKRSSRCGWKKRPSSLWKSRHCCRSFLHNFLLCLKKPFHLTRDV